MIDNISGSEEVQESSLDHGILNSTLKDKSTGTSVNS